MIENHRGSIDESATWYIVEPYGEAMMLLFDDDAAWNDPDDPRYEVLDVATSCSRRVFQ